MIVFLILLTTVCLSRQYSDVSALEFRGTTVFTREELLQGFLTKVGNRYDPIVLRVDVEQLRKRYVQAGYLHATIDTLIEQTAAPSVAVSIVVNEKKQSRIGTVGILGSKALSEPAIQNGLPAREGSVFTQSCVEDGVQHILKTYESAGFPLTKVTVKDIVFSEKPGYYQVDFMYNIIEGKQVKIRELRVLGNTLTKESVIAREAKLTSDSFYSEQLSASIKHRLERLQLFSSVSEPELFLNQNEEGGLLLKVQEGSPNRFDGIVGYVPSSRPGEDAYVTGLVDLQFRNLFGTARKLAARWFREDRATQEIELRYAEPWVAGVPLDAEGGFFQRVQDSTFVRRRYDGSVRFFMSDEVSLGGAISFIYVVPTEGFGKSVVSESQTTSAGLSVTYDTRSDPVTPTSGIFYQTEYQFGVKNISASSTVTKSSDRVQKIFMDLRLYVQPIVRNVLCAEMHIQDYRTNIIEIGDLFRLGGAATLRGYREGQFTGSRIVWSTLEYRYLTDARSYLYTFLDAGYVAMPALPGSQTESSEQTRLGFGIGLRIDSKLGLIGVSLAFGEGDTFSTAKLHVRLINAF
jgi:outer membrane protein assembly factor BamA